eukprot:1143680-Pelagomonas_calceolata.AAC.1
MPELWANLDLSVPGAKATNDIVEAMASRGKWHKVKTEAVECLLVNPRIERSSWAAFVAWSAVPETRGRKCCTGGEQGGLPGLPNQPTALAEQSPSWQCSQQQSRPHAFRVSIWQKGLSGRVDKASGKRKWTACLFLYLMPSALQAVRAFVLRARRTGGYFGPTLGRKLSTRAATSGVETQSSHLL